MAGLGLATLNPSSDTLRHGGATTVLVCHFIHFHPNAGCRRQPTLGDIAQTWGLMNFGGIHPNMVRVENRPSGGHEYIVVVHDYKDENNKWRRNIIKNFGRANTPEVRHEADAYAAAINAGEILLKVSPDTTQDTLSKSLKPILKGALTGAAVGAVMGSALAWLYAKEHELKQLQEEN